VKQVPETTIYHHNACGATWDPTEVKEEPEPHVSDEQVAAALVPVEPLPVMPLPGEWEQILGMAVAFSKAQICPRALKGKPNDMALVLWTGRELGVPLTSAMREVYVIEGTTTISPKLKLGRVQMLGLGKIIPDPLAEQSKTSATALALLNERCQLCQGASGWLIKDGEPVPCPACHTTGFKPAGPPHTFTWEDARIAGLISATDDCTPDHHVCKHGDKWRCKDNWRHWPKNMTWWRASTQSVDIYFPQAGLGLYTPDDVGIITDINGEIIDVDVVQTWTSDAPAETPPASAEQVADIRWRVAALPEAQRTEFVNRWTEKVEEGRLEPVRELLSSHVALGTALLQGAESMANREGWEAPPYPADVVAAVAEQDAARAAAREVGGGPAVPPAEAGSEAPREAPDQGEARNDPSSPIEAPTGQEEASPGQGAGEAPAEAPAGTPAAERTRALAAQIGQAMPVLTDGVLDEAIERVRAMTVRQLNAELRKRLLDVEKVAENVRRQNLAKAVAAELAEADWAEANGK
jgi:hypothetical protein